MSRSQLLFQWRHVLPNVNDQPHVLPVSKFSRSRDGQMLFFTFNTMLKRLSRWSLRVYAINIFGCYSKTLDSLLWGRAFSQGTINLRDNTNRPT